MDFIKLFEPITINKTLVKNRIVMPAMGLFMTDDYSFNERYRSFYRERGRGGVGLMVVGPLAVDRVGSAPFMPGLFEDGFVEPLRAFVDEMHQTTDATIGTQLFHMGRYAYSAFSGMTSIGPSAIPSRLTKETPRAMTKDDIETIKDAFASAARRAKEAGFDYIEIIACTGYLISQFLSPITNRRTDEYGGPIENRMRFGIEVIQAVRKTVGPDVAVGIRIAGHDFMDGGHTNKESAAFAAAAQKAGVDAVNVTGGWHETNVPQLTTNVPPGVFVYLARGIKQQVTVPVFASNRLGDPILAEKVLRAGSADMICWARPLIADPSLPDKVRQRRFDEIVSCISCNQGCFDSIFYGRAVHCVLNPSVGREDEARITRAEKKKKVLVAGGGPGGMEFALTAAARGHDVTLYEKDEDLGGQINLAKVPPGKHELQKIIDSMKNRMEHNGVRIKAGAALSEKTVREEKPDYLVVATGARPIDIRVPGIDKPHVVSAWDVLSDRIADIGKRVVIVGGSATGCETAHYLTSMGVPDPEAFTFLMYHNAEDPLYAMELLHKPGREVVVIDMVDRMADNVSKTARWSLMKSLKVMGVKLMPGTKLLEITDDAVVVETGKGKETIPADTVIIAVGARSVNELAASAQKDGVSVITIGDAKAPRKITDAVREGFEEALTI
ncbi:MAG: FAD-dependent oxidoreductase [Deltaproteobacteria bacterium]|nr:FAD-dependent oxidoreductase [Candidatus Zymogenaceae bacterium]